MIIISPPFSLLLVRFLPSFHFSFKIFLLNSSSPYSSHLITFLLPSCKVSFIQELSFFRFLRVNFFLLNPSLSLYHFILFLLLTHYPRHFFSILFTQSPHIHPKRLLPFNPPSFIHSLLVNESTITMA